MDLSSFPRHSCVGCSKKASQRHSSTRENPGRWHQREVQRPLPRRVPEHGVVPLASGGSGRHRNLAQALQQRSTPFESRRDQPDRAQEKVREVRRCKPRGKFLVSVGPLKAGTSASPWPARGRCVSRAARTRMGSGGNAVLGGAAHELLQQTAAPRRPARGRRSTRFAIGSLPG